MDALSDMLERSRARGAAFSHSTLHGAWGLRFPGDGEVAVHAIVDGELHAWVDDAGHAQRLGGGDVVLVRADEDHHLAHVPGAPCVPWAQFAADADAGEGASRRLVRGEPGDGPAASFCCGAYLFEGDLCTPLLRSLPHLVRLQPRSGSPLRVVVDLLIAEMGRDGPGQQALLDRLLDVALVEALREHLATLGEDAPGWFRARRDPGLAAALDAVHADPARSWTVAELADRAHLSRATFSRRFAEVVGDPPLQYLTAWRMALARERLRDTGDGLAAIAASIGYASEFSFAAAFKRHVGTAPGRWRAGRDPDGR